MKQPFFIIVTGPTGVGKSSFAEKLAATINGEIINGDMGQLYTPLSIGTAKPDWQNAEIPHHLFDELDEPELYTVTQYRKRVASLLEECWKRNTVPIVVGGSLFYIQSLFFPPIELDTSGSMPPLPPDDQLWDLLNSIDPQRAGDLSKTDIYRVNRALEIYYTTGRKPSELAPQYQPLASAYIFHCTRDRSQLYNRINKRVAQMMDEGWIQEACNLRDTAWEQFLHQKKVIGYDDILSVCNGKDIGDEALQGLIETIAQKTRHYAKRQETFWRRLERNLAAHKNNDRDCTLVIDTLNLSLFHTEKYVEHVVKLLPL